VLKDTLREDCDDRPDCFEVFLSPITLESICAKFEQNWLKDNLRNCVHCQIAIFTHFPDFFSSPGARLTSNIFFKPLSELLRFQDCCSSILRYICSHGSGLKFIFKFSKLFLH